MKMKGVQGVATATLLMLLAGCSDGGSVVLPTDWVKTIETYPTIRSVQYVDDSVETTVELHPFDSAIYLLLTEGDQLLSSLNAPPEQFLSFNDNLFSNTQDLSNSVITLEQRYYYFDFDLFYAYENSKEPEYSAVNQPDGVSPPTVYITYDRTEEKSATASITLPSEYLISFPKYTDEISRAAGDLTLTWSNSDPDSTMYLNVGAMCDDGEQYTTLAIYLGNADTATLATDDYLLGVPVDATCNVSFVLQRINSAFLSQFGFGGGTIEGIQQRTVQFTSIP